MVLRSLGSLKFTVGWVYPVNAESLSKPTQLVQVPAGTVPVVPILQVGSSLSILAHVAIVTCR